ncbi:MAG: peptide MFS transporter, partial [Gammaproteobacteria bacterium]|nr:peptide MFS transporter [Gammaproteobacteria bacterium]
MHHPKGLWVLFIAEMWERFSYYGMRALLVLYLISSTSEELASGAANLNPGFGWSEEAAYLLYGIYTWAVYLTPIVGGWLADRFLGTHRSMIVGGWIIAAGHILLAGTELFGITAGAAVTLQTGPGALLCFVGGLALIVVGTGFFKPCVSVMVGQLYGPNDERRDGGFTIFYMGINVGALLAPLIAGTLGETVGWHWGFGSAAIGMILGITLYQTFRSRYLEGIGLPPKAEAKPVGETEPRPPLSRVEWQRIGVILVLAFIANIAFWAAFEQAGSSMNVFAAQKTDRTLWGPP